MSSGGKLSATRDAQGVVPAGASSMTTKTSNAPACRTFSASAALATMAARAPESRSRCAWSATVFVVYAGTGTARMAIKAVSAIGYSGRFSAQISTRSPAETPTARSCRAQEAAIRANSFHETPCHAPAL